MSKFNLHFLATLFTVAFLSFTSSIFAQSGKIQGLIVESATNEPVIGARILVSNTSMGCVSDFDGNFEIALQTGRYDLIVTAPTYDTMIVQKVVVTSNESTQVPIIQMNKKITEIEGITVQATRKTNTESAMIYLKMKSLNAIDGVSEASIKKSGDSDAANAMGRIPGVSVANGKYVFIRGIGDRYNKTLLNGMELPGLDPDKNSMQLDIMPTAILSNIVIHKTALAELPADFAGGVMDMNIKSIPDDLKGSVSLNIGYNRNHHFNKSFLTQTTSSTDFLGFDGGLRTIPATSNIPFYANVLGNPNGANAQRYKEVLSKFNPNMGAVQRMSGMDAGMNVHFGNKHQLKKSTFGYQFLVSYANQTEFFKDAEFNRYGLKADASQTEMEVREHQKGSYGVNSIFLNGLFGMGWSREKSDFTFHVMHLQNGESKSGIFNYESTDQGANFSGYQHNLEYTQRGMTNAQLNGKHSFGNTDKWKAHWTVASTYSTQKDPDVRFTRYRVQESGVSIGTESGFPERIWRDMNEVNVSAKSDFKRMFTAFKQEAEVKFGVGSTWKQRAFNIRSFMVNVRNIELTGNPDELFSEENLWPYRNDVTSGTTVEASFLPNNPNQFNASVNNTFGYVSTVLSPASNFKAIIGLRAEHYVQKYTGRDQMGYNVMDQTPVLQSIDLFPSVNLMYSITERQNFRLSYGKTIARPSLKELSYAEIVDPLTGRTFIGGMFKDEDKGSGMVYWDGNLKSTDIHNIDLRWEIFPTLQQTISVSAFYKYFENPIEMVQYASQAGSFQPRNVGNGQVIGGEVELKIGFDFITPKLRDLALISNVTVAHSRIQLNETEKQSRLANAREGEVIKGYRNMAGQAPYVVNVGLNYQSSVEKGFFKSFEAGVFYNVQGSTLIYVGMVDRPDVYSVPFHSLNFNLNKKFGKSDQWNVGLKITNLVNDKKEEVYKSYQATNQYFSRLSLGTTTSIKVGYTF